MPVWPWGDPGELEEEEPWGFATARASWKQKTTQVEAEEQMCENTNKSTICLNKYGCGSAAVRVGHLYYKFQDKRGPKALQNYPASFGTRNFSNSLWENPRSPRVYDFRTWWTCPWLPKPIFLTPDTSKCFGNTKNNKSFWGNTVVENSELGIEKARAPKP